jgi:hypothetical protein
MKNVKKVGRPQGRKGRPLQLYAEDGFITAIDEWRRRQPDLPNRSVAIRRLVEQALAAESSAAKPPGRPGKSSKVLKSVHRSAKRMHEGGHMDDATMAEFDALCLEPAPKPPRRPTRGGSKREGA